MKAFGGALFGVAAVIFLWTFNTRSRLEGENSLELEVLFPISVLIEGPQLLDPANTETIWEYYLLENLGCGLIRDSKDAPVGYEGCIAERFYQQDAKTWVFKLRDLQWSDNTQVTPAEIKGWIEDLRANNKRHVQYLKLAETIEYDSDTRILEIKFPFAVDASLLHELSLADASLTPPNYKLNGWHKTVGPYFVKHWDKTGNVLNLSANRNSPLYRPTMPKSVSIHTLNSPAEKALLFGSINIDVILIPALASPAVVGELVERAPQIYESHPVSIGYFSFNKNNRLTEKLENREKFAAIVANIRNLVARDFVDKLETLHAEDQMIPQGFSGRLVAAPPVLEGLGHSLRRIVVRLPIAFASWPNFCEVFVGAFRDQGVEVDLNFAEQSTVGSDEFAALQLFVGNQLEAAGSWSFLLAPPHGTLSTWYDDVRGPFEQAFKINPPEVRHAAFQRLHEVVLAKAIAVPFVKGSSRYLLSDRVDPEDWNKFDSRMRLYELKWK